MLRKVDIFPEHGVLCSVFEIVILELAASALPRYFLEMQTLWPRTDLLNQQSILTSFLVILMHAQVGKPLVYMPSGDPSNWNMGFLEERLVRW